SMRQGVLQVSITQRQQRPLFQLKQEHCKPQTADAYRSHEIHPVQPKTGLMEAGSHLPEKVEEAHGNNQSGNPHKCAARALQTPRKEQREWKGEMKYHQQKPYPLPAAPEALDIPRDLVRQIARPDD